MPEDETGQQTKRTFFAELKERKVFRVGATYAVVSWLIVQISSATFSSFGIPDWAFRFIVLTLMLGFPVALILAWAFELTPDGVKLTRSMTPENRAVAAQSSSKRNWIAIGLAAALPTVIFGTLALVFYLGRSDPGAADEGRGGNEAAYHIGKIAVLPIQVISGGEPLQRMSQGLQEELLTRFSAMEPLSVVSRTSTLRYQKHDKSMREIGTELGADYVVEGSLRENGSRWRLTLQPIEAGTDLHLASLDYDFDATSEDLLLFQREAAWRSAIDVYQALRKHHPPAGNVAVRRDERISGLIADMEQSEAAFWGNDEKPADRSLLPALLEKAQQIIKLDPDNAVAHRKFLAFKAQVRGGAAGDFKAWQQDMRFAIVCALRLDPEHFDTQLQAGSFYLHVAQRPDIALPYLRRGLTLYEKNSDFSYNWPYYHLAWALLQTGSADAALNVLKRAPETPAFSELAVWIATYEFTRRFEEAIGFVKVHLEKAAGEKNAQAELDLSSRLAYLEAWWTGSLEPLANFYRQAKDNPLATPAMKAMLLMALQDHEAALKEMSAIDIGSDPSASNSINFMAFRAYALRESGNPHLATSYLQNSIESLEANETYLATMPGNAYAVIALLHAMAGNKTASRQAAMKSEANQDATRNILIYYFDNGLLAQAYFEAGEIQKGCEKLDLILSGPSGSSVGRVLVEFQNPSLLKDPRFQAVIRKHAGQLKDPAILDRYFSRQ